MLANARYTTRPPLSPHLQPGADAPVVSTHAPVGVRGEALANERGEVLLSSIVPEAPGWSAGSSLTDVPARTSLLSSLKSMVPLPSESKRPKSASTPARGKRTKLSPRVRSEASSWGHGKRPRC